MVTNMQGKAQTKKFLPRIFATFTIFQTILIVIFISCGITLAFLSATETLTNKFVIAKPDIEIIEPNTPDPSDVEWGADNKNVSVKVSEDAGDVYVKVMLVISAKGGSNVYPFNFGAMSAPDPDTNELIMGDFTLHFDADWQEDWFFKDGSFYYKHILKSNEQTSVLLRGITLTQDTPKIRDKYRNMLINIDVLANSIQAKGDAVLEWGVVFDTDGVTLKP